VQASRAGDELVVTVAGNRRVLSLPSVLRRCEVVGGELDGGQLRVRFRPDPHLWPSADQRWGST
jgi:arsenite-transporting ATPase